MIVNRPPNQRRLPPPVRQETQNAWLIALLLLLLLCYWLFAWYLERIDLTLVFPRWWTSFFDQPMPGWLVFVREFFHWRVLRHLIPLFVGWWLAYEATVSLVRVLYDLSDRQAAAKFLSRLRRSGAPTIPPVSLNGQTLEEDRQKWAILRVGGPGLVTVGSSDVAVTELNGRFYRVLGPGTHKLNRFEYVHAVLDLRPQKRSAEDVSLTTRDGIQVQVSLEVNFRIATGNAPPTKARPYPYDETAVRQAAYTITVKDKGQLSLWDDQPLGRARGILTNLIAQRQLDQLLTPDSAADEPLAVIQNNLFRQLRDGLASTGIELLDVRLGALKLPAEVSNQYVQYWNSHLEAQIQMRLADGQATALQEKEIARAEAEATMIQAILEGVRRARYSGNITSIREVVALRMVEALEKMARQSQQAYPLPADLLGQLTSYRRQIAPGQETDRDEEKSE